MRKLHKEVIRIREKYFSKVLQYILLILLVTYTGLEIKAILTPYKIYIDNSAVEVKAHAEAGDKGNGQAQPVPALSLEDKIIKAFPNDPDMLKIAIAESHLKPDAVNVNSNGTKDCGIFQINSVHGYDCDWLKAQNNNNKRGKFSSLNAAYKRKCCNNAIICTIYDICHVVS